MPKYRTALPQLSGDLFLLDAGLETDLIFNHGIDIPEFAAHTLLPDPKGRDALVNYFRYFLSLANATNSGLILGATTWKTHMHWAKDLGASEADLRQANHDSIAFISELRDEFSGNAKPIVLDAIIGPRGDAYAPEESVAADEAERYHAKQIGWLAETEVDMVTGLTFTQSDEAIGFVRAAAAAGLPSVMSFTVETDGKLPTGQQHGDGLAVLAIGDGVGHGCLDSGLPRDRAKRALDRTTLNDLDKVFVAEQRRILKNRGRDNQLNIPSQMLNYRAQHRVRALDFLGDDLAHLRQLIMGKNLENLEGQFLDLVPGVLAEVGRNTANFARQIATHFVIHILGQQPVGLARSLFVAGDLAPHRGQLVGGKIIKNLWFDVASLRQSTAMLTVMIGGERLGFVITYAGGGAVADARARDTISAISA
jgi:S-methylmethionine-dependent homocysteine/selenocysteine methylase